MNVLILRRTFIVSDRDPKFTSEFWEAFNKAVGTKLQMTTVDFAQANGQAERANGAIVQMLRAYCSEKPKAWSSLLPGLEFAYNSAPSASTGISPFQACYGYAPRSTLDFVVAPNIAGPATDLMESLNLAQQIVRDNLVSAQDRQAETANASKRAHDIAPGDKVYLSTDHAVPSTSVSDKDKLRERFAGPIDVISVDGNTALLDFKDNMEFRTHPRVNVSKLRKAVSPVAPLPQPPPDPDGSYEVDMILAQRLNRREEVEYLVRWLGYGANHDEWIPAADLENAKDVLKEFTDRQSRARKDRRQI